MNSKEMLETMTENQIKVLQMGNGDEMRKARRSGINLDSFAEISDACQLALIAYTDARVYQKKLVTRGNENAVFVVSSLDDRTARMMIVVNSHVLDNEPVVVREPFDYSW